MGVDRLPGLGRRAGRALLSGAGAAMAWFGLWLLLCVTPAATQVPAAHLESLRRGVNITNWFRFLANASPEWLRGYLSDAVMQELRATGFTFVRLCIQPQLLLRADGRLDPARLHVVLDAVRRLQRAGLAVVDGRASRELAHRG